MVAFLRQGLTRTLPITGAVIGAVLLCFFTLLMPADWLEAVVEGSGIAALIPAAAPPLTGGTQLAIAGGVGIAGGAVLWAVFYLLFGPGGPFYVPQIPRPVDGVPTLRRADAHPDAPARRPLSASQELAVPPPPKSRLPQPDVSLPADLDTPLASFDPQAILPVPREPVRPVAPLTPPPPPAPTPSPAPPPPRPAPPASPPPAEPADAEALAPGERMETFQLTPANRIAPSPAAPEEPPSIDMLLRRLEAGAKRRAGQEQ